MALGVLYDNLETSSPKVLDNKNGIFEGGIWRPYNTLGEYTTRYPFLPSRAETQIIFVRSTLNNDRADLYIIDKNKVPFKLVPDIDLSPYRTSIAQDTIDDELNSKILTAQATADVAQEDIEQEITDRTAADAALLLLIEENKGLKTLTIAEVRALSSVDPIPILYTTNNGQEGLWEYDSTDTTSVDNLGTVLVDTLGRRYKRVLDEPNTFNVTWFGAIGDAFTDNTPAIQATINVARADQNQGGTVLVPNGFFDFYDTLIVGALGEVPSTTAVSIRGMGSSTTFLRWRGASDKTAIFLRQNKYFKFEGFYLVNQTGVRGTTVGLHQGGFGGIGTECLGGLFERIIIVGFHKGMQVGGSSDGEPSVAASDNLYHLIEIHNCDYGWINNDLNTLNHVFTQMNVGGCIVGMKVQVGNVFWRGGSTYSNSRADIEADCDLLHISDIRSEVLGRFILAGNVGNLSVDHCDTVPAGVLDGIHIQVGDPDRAPYNASITNCLLQGKVAVTPYPSIRNLYMANNKWAFGITDKPFDLQPVVGGVGGIFNYTCLNNDLFPDVIGGRMAMPGTYLSEPFFVDNLKIVKNSNRDFFTDVHLQRTPCLSPIKIAGKNMRLQRQFEGDSELAVLFVRDVLINSVNTPPFPKKEIVGGGIYPSDLGSVTTVGPYTSHIYKIDIDNNHIYSLNPEVPPPYNNVPATIGENEPDEHYLAIATGDAEEVFWITNKTATGFTVNSSNPTSTAMVDILIIR
ncbi:hypothetical protein WG904_03460 [Pedobacter sp. Du54]|uniref:hypothetical protein n=1 Tax=Pedobacter anseongensis TaxID=3133439 RepID=UPI0030A06356